MTLLYLCLVSLIANVLMVSAAGKVTVYYSDDTEYDVDFGFCHNNYDEPNDRLFMVHVSEPGVCSSYPQFYCKGQPISTVVYPGTAYEPTKDSKSVGCLKK